MKKHWCLIRIENGEIVNKNTVKDLFKQLQDGRYQVETTEISKRSNPQNRYLHGLLIPEFRKALNSVGYDVKDDVQAKLIIKAMFLKRNEINKETGEVIEYVQDTSALTKFEMNTLIEEVIMFAAQNMNYVIPYPNEQLAMYE